MFVLRKAHLDSLSKAAMESFEDRMVPHLRASFPDECEELGEIGIRVRIQEGVERAKGHEIVAEKDVARFIHFMFTIRPDFDTSLRTRWAAAILGDVQAPPGERLERIKTEAKKRRRTSE